MNAMVLVWKWKDKYVKSIVQGFGFVENTRVMSRTNVVRFKIGRI